MLKDGKIAARLPAQDLERARRFYAEKLGLEPVDERPGGLLYRPTGGGEFALFQSAGASDGSFTQMGWEVEDIEATAAALRANGVELEQYDIPGIETVDGIAEIEGNYAIKKATGERAIWFHDSEGNLLGVGELVREGD